VSLLSDNYCEFEPGQKMNNYVKEAAFVSIVLTQLYGCSPDTDKLYIDAGKILSSVKKSMNNQAPDISLTLESKVGDPDEIKGFVTLNSRYGPEQIILSFKKRQIMPGETYEGMLIERKMENTGKRMKIARLLNKELGMLMAGKEQYAVTDLYKARMN
jgi:hypothetical protein